MSVPRTKSATMVPTITAAMVPPLDALVGLVEEGEGEDRELVWLGFAEVAVRDTVNDGALETDVGEFLSRHVESSDNPTGKNSVAPPCRPFASCMMKATVVPAAMSAVQSKIAPLGGFKTKDEPLGMMPCKSSEKVSRM